MTIHSRNEFRAITTKAAERVDKYRQAVKHFPVLESIARQLAFIQERSTDTGPSKEDAARITVGVIAIRELEEFDPELAQWLVDLNYYFERWHALP